MKTHVEFRSESFPPYEGEDELVNPGLWGKRLAEHLERELNALGIATNGISPEDWGWIVSLEHDGFESFVGCGHQNGDDESFLCFIHPDKPAVRRWLKRVDTSDHVQRIAEALDRILSSNPDIRDLRWWDDAETG